MPAVLRGLHVASVLIPHVIYRCKHSTPCERLPNRPAAGPSRCPHRLTASAAEPQPLPQVMAAPTPDQLKQWFDSIDADRTGTITPAELQRAMALGGLQFSLMACAQMVRLHDRDNSGTISFPEFASLHMQLTEIRTAFTTAARGGDSISAEQVTQLVAQQGYRLEAPAVQAVCRSFDPDRNGRFGLPEYTMLCVFLLASKQIFSAFDPQHSGRVTFDYSQFVYAAAQTR